MTDWNLLFGAVRDIANRTSSIEEGFAACIKFTRDHPSVFKEPKFWDAAELAAIPTSIETISKWATAGLDKLPPGQGWEILLLDLGDCPEVFDLMRFAGPGDIDIEKYRTVVSECPAIGAESLMKLAVGTFEWPWTSKRLFEERDLSLPPSFLREALSMSNYSEKLADDLYFLWHTAATLAFADSLRRSHSLGSVLRGRSVLYVLTGFEELFTHTFTIVEGGVSMKP